MQGTDNYNPLQKNDFHTTTGLGFRIRTSAVRVCQGSIEKFERSKSEPVNSSTVLASLASRIESGVLS